MASEQKNWIDASNFANATFGIERRRQSGDQSERQSEEAKVTGDALQRRPLVVLAPSTSNASHRL